jgi:hypothetical protein
MSAGLRVASPAVNLLFYHGVLAPRALALAGRRLRPPSSRVMDRRAFIGTFGLLAAALAAGAQQAKVWRIGLLVPGLPPAAAAIRLLPRCSRCGMGFASSGTSR